MKRVLFILVLLGVVAPCLHAVDMATIIDEDLKLRMSQRLVNDPSIPLKGIIWISDYGAATQIFNRSEWHEFADQNDLAIFFRGYNAVLEVVRPRLGDTAAVQWNRPELAGLPLDYTTGDKPKVPWIFAGVSATGTSSMGAANSYPQVALAVLNYRGRLQGSTYDVDVPLLQCQSYSEQVSRMSNQYDDALVARETNGHPWTSVLQYNAPHNALGDYTFAMEWLSAVIDLRYPVSGVFDMDTNPLRPIDMNAASAGGRYTLVNNNSATGTSDGDFSYENTSLEPFSVYSRDTWLPTQKLADMWLAANQQYTVTFQTAGTGSGTLDKTSAVVWGTCDTAVAITLAAGSTIDKWTDGSGATIGTNTTLDVKDVMANDTITAHLGGNSVPDPLVSVSKTGNGSLVTDYQSTWYVNQDVQTLAGQDLTFGIIPDVGNQQVGLTVDSGAVPYATTYSFSNLQANRSIHVDFASAGNPGSSGHDGTMHLKRYTWANNGWPKPKSLAALKNSLDTTYVSPTDDQDLSLNNTDISTADEDKYLARYSTYLYPPVSGTYTFRVATDMAALYLSSDYSETNISLIAEDVDVANSYSMTLGRLEQQSVPVTLQAGEPYYFQIDYYESFGGQSLKVSWEIDGYGHTYIPGDCFSTTLSLPIDPVAAFTATPISGFEPLEVVFDASASSTPVGSITGYSWDFDSDGSVDATGFQVTNTYAAGSFTATLTVTNDSNVTAFSTETLTVHAAGSAITGTLSTASAAQIDVGNADVAQSNTGLRSIKYGGSQYTRYILARFDVSQLVGVDVTSATLNINVKHGDSSNQLPTSIFAYAVPDGNSGQSWTGGTSGITWNQVISTGLIPDLGVGLPGNYGQLIPVGQSPAINYGDNGWTWVSDPRIADQLDADTDGKVTFLFAQEQGYNVSVRDPLTISLDYVGQVSGSNSMGDRDNDGVIDFLEIAFGTDPNDGADTPDLLGDFRPKVDGLVDYNVRNMTDGYTYELQISTNLVSGSWQTVTNFVGSGGPSTVTIDKSKASLDGQLYMRIKVSK